MSEIPKVPPTPDTEGPPVPEVGEAKKLNPATEYMSGLALRGAGLVDLGVDLGKRFLARASTSFQENSAAAGVVLTNVQEWSNQAVIDAKDTSKEAAIVAARTGKKAVFATGRGVKKGAFATGRGVKKGALATGRAGKRVGVAAVEGTAEAIRDGFDSAEVAISGLREATRSQWEWEVEQRAERHDHDAEVYEQAGRTTLTKVGIQPDRKEYDPLNKWTGKHRTRRSGFGFMDENGVVDGQVPAWPDPNKMKVKVLDANGDVEIDEDGKEVEEWVDRTLARNIPQKQAELRANRRADVIKRLDGESRRLLEMYGDVLFDKDAIGELIRTQHIDRVAAGALKSAGRQVRKKARTSGRVGGRLIKSAEGRDAAGAYARSRRR